MRVLLTSVILKSGLLTHVWDLAKHLKTSGIDVSVAILNIEEGKRKTDHSLIQPIIDESISYIFYNDTKELVKFAVKQKSQLVHAHSRLVFLSSKNVSKNLSIPLVLTLHGPFNWRKYYSGTLDHAKQVIAIGPAQAMHTNLQQSKKLNFIENGVDIKRFSPVQPINLGGNWSKVGDIFNNYLYYGNPPLRIIWFGRSDGSASDGVNALNQAVKQLRSKGKEIDLKMIGRNNAKKMDQFEIIGWVDDPVPFLQDSDIAFGHGRALREAMACGNVGFLLGNGYGGIVEESWLNRKIPKPLSALSIYNLPNPNPTRIAKDIEVLYDNHSLLAKQQKEARRIAVKYLDVKKMVAKTINVYKKALASNKRKK